MEVDVRTAKTREQHIVENLMQLYLHDYSEFEELQLQEDGCFAYESLDLYWQDPNRYPFLFRVDGQLVGFALLRFEVDFRVMQERMELIEFFILRRHRRKGIGRAAAERLWNLFPGRWSLRVPNQNMAGYAFFRQAISDYAGGKFEEQKEEGMVSRWTSFAFESNTPRIPEDQVPEDPVDY